MAVDEIRDLKPGIISDLKKKGFNILDIGGTFDLYVDIDKGKGFFIELKVANANYKAWAGKRGVKGLDLTSRQTSTIRSMKNLPIIFACDEDDMNTCYLILPDELKRLANERTEYEDILIGVKHLERKSYDDALSDLAAYLNGNLS